MNSNPDDASASPVGKDDFSYYLQWAERFEQSLRKVIAGEIPAPPSKAFDEAWLAYAIHWRPAPVTMAELLAYADALEHSVPTEEEAVGALAALLRRGWISFADGRFALTYEGRGAIAKGVGWDLHMERDRLRRWIETQGSEGKR